MPEGQGKSDTDQEQGHDGGDGDARLCPPLDVEPRGQKAGFLCHRWERWVTGRVRRGRQWSRRPRGRRRCEIRNARCGPCRCLAHGWWRSQKAVLYLTRRRPRGDSGFWLAVPGGLRSQGVNFVVADNLAAHDQRRGLTEKESTPLVASIGIGAPLRGRPVLGLGHMVVSPRWHPSRHRIRKWVPRSR